MKGFRIVVLGTGVVLAAGIAVAIAGTPFGGDDTGTIPSDAPKGAVTKCENGVGKSVGKLVGAIGKCTAKEASGKLVGDAAEEPCEDAAITKFGATKTVGCAGCTNLTTTGALVRGLLDTNNNMVYCSSAGSAFGGDDTGNIPSDAPKGAVTKCQNGVNKAVGKLVAALIKCHASEASGKLAGDAAEEPCEDAAITKFGATKTVGCDSCTNLTALGTFVRTTVDSSNAVVYCGSPSGAFVQ